MRTSTGARLRRLAVLGAAAAAIMTAAATPAAAGPSPDPSAGSTAGPTGERAKKLCGRLPQLLARIDKVLARLQGGADQPGSVEFVKKRAEKARANGHTDLATALDSRAKARADMIPVLQKRRAEGLPKLTDWCTSHGYGTGE
jgi:hypothetical protein